MTKPPRYLYHAAPICVRDNIWEKGLHTAWSEVYAAESPEHALRFMSFRLLMHYHGSKSVMLNGALVEVPDIVEHDSIDVWKIDTHKTRLKQWEVGEDHSPAFFGEDVTSWRYGGDISKDALVNVTQYAPTNSDKSKED